MKHLLIAGALAGLAGTAGAVAVEFNVPVELRNIVDQATHVVVTCGSWDNTAGSRRFLWSESVEVPLQQGVKHKFYSGVVKVTIPFPGTTVPTGAYRCTMGMRGRTSSGEFSQQPAAPGSRAVTEVIGNFSELNYQQGISATVKPPAAPLLPGKQPPPLTHK
jgi:hypothetical protein